MTEIDWKSLVDRDAKGKATPEEQALLRQPEHLDLWKAHLALAIAAIDRQIASSDYSLERLDLRRDEGTVEPDEHAERTHAQGLWRRKALFSKAKYVERTQEAKMLIVQRNASPEWQRSTVALYRKAIAAHRSDTLADDIEPTEADKTLWALLNRDDL